VALCAARYACAHAHVYVHVFMHMCTQAGAPRRASRVMFMLQASDALHRAAFPRVALCAAR